MLDFFHSTLRWVHIAMGFAGLIFFWAAAVMPKGGVMHRRFGSSFIWTARVVVITAVVSCLWQLLHPESFAGVGSLELVQRRAMRATGSLLCALAMMTWSASELGVRSLCTRHQPKTLLNWRLRFSFWFQGLAGALLLTIAVMDGMATNWQPRYWFCLLLGVLTILNAMGEYQYSRNPPSTQMTWLAKHIECMIGCGIAFHTALLITVAQRLFGDYLPGPLAILPWVLPTVIGLPLSVIIVRRYTAETAAEPIHTSGPTPVSDET